MTKQRGFLDVDGARVEVLFAGERRRDVPTLVFLHEGLGSVAQWRDFPARIAYETGLPAFAYIRRGHGASDPVALPRPLTYLEDEARFSLPRVLEAARIGETILVGHSDGASIAIVHAALDARVRGLVLEAPHLFVEDLSIASIRKTKEAYETDDLRSRLAKYHANVDVTFRGWNDAWLDPRFREVLDLEPWIARVTVPTLVIQGDDDPYGTRAQVDAVVRGAGGPVEVRLLPECEHAPHRDQPDETADAIVAFVERVLSSA